MLVKDLIKDLKKYDLNSEILLGSDEELNSVYYGIETAELTAWNKVKKEEEPSGQVVIYGLSGQEKNIELDLSKEEIEDYLWFIENKKGKK